MRFNDAAPPVSVTIQPASELDIDVLVVGAFDKEPLTLPEGLDGATRSRLEEAASSGEFPGKSFATFVIPATGRAWKPARVMLVGLGTTAAYSPERLRQWASAAALRARERRLRRLAFVLPQRLAGPVEAGAVAEGVTLAAFYGGVYKNDRTAEAPSLEPRLVVASDTGALALDDIERASSKGYILGACANLARSLVNEPANRMTPRIFATVAEQVAAAVGLKVDVLDEDRITGLDLGLMMAVAHGSAEPPRLVVLRYDPPRPGPGPVLGLVGKGVTFDAGGLSLKTVEGMADMKTDMAGAAIVLGAMKAIAALKPEIPVVAVIPLVENMPDGKAIRPGDVLRAANGRTVEVRDTDAEGRLVLGDGLWYAGQLGATHLLDVATLTSACIVALGVSTSGLFGAPDWWTAVVHRVTARAGDRSWVMPMFDDYREQLRSEVADFSNVGGKPAGAITAAMFLEEFVGDLPWVHLDVAGTVWADEAKPYQPKGPTGVGVRSLVALALSADEWGREPEARGPASPRATA
jgi:leucyl aminopeptidase